MTQLLASPAHPDGWTLEDVLEALRGDMMRRSAHMVDDPRPEVRRLIANNVAIMEHLTHCLHRAQESARVLDKIGAGSGPGSDAYGKRR